MMKLTVSFDEFLEDEFANASDTDHDMLFDFLTDQFPSWDIGLAFDVNSIEWDFENREVSILMIVQENTERFDFPEAF